MEVTVQTKNLDLSDEVKVYALKKISRLGRYLPAINGATVELGREGAKSALNRVVVQVTVECPGAILRAEERAPDVYAAVDAVADVMKRQVSRYKGKLYWKGWGVAPQPSPAPGAEAAPEAEEGLPDISVVKVKRFSLKPMYPQEAIEQMELLDHSFFLFQDADSNLFSVVYRRQDGDYGLLQAEMA